MKLKTSIGLFLPSLTLLATALHAAEMPPAAAASAETASGTTVTTAITPRIFGFHTFEGWWGDRTHFLERYDYREGFGGDNRSDVFADLDLDVTVNNGERDQFVLERRGFGEHNHRGSAKFSNDALNVYGTYSHFRSATGGIDYRFRPDEPELLNGGGTGGTVPPATNPGFARTFNNDADRNDYSIDRTTYGAGFKIKPEVLGGSATVSVDYAGYRRDGNKFAPFLLDGGGAINGQDRWRGINLNVDEHMNKVGLTLTASPKKLFEVAYEVSYEQFVSDAAELQIQRDITTPAGIGSTSASPIASLFYVPDANLINHGIRASKNFNDRVTVAAGYGASWLKQDSFSEYGPARQTALRRRSAARPRLAAAR